MESSKADSFTAFLQERQRLKSVSQTPRPAASPMTILGVLAGASDRQMLVQEVQAASGMSFGDFAAALNGLRDSGYLTLSGPPGGESVVLTALGVDVAGLTRPR